MIDYTYLYRDVVTAADLATGGWDVLISAYNPTERVRTVFEAADAHQKDWLVHSEYGLATDKLPKLAFSCQSEREDEYVVDYAEARLPGSDFSSISFCIDLTGLMRPHLLYLVKYLSLRGAKRFDAIYAEPGHYSHLDATNFASEQVHTVRQVAGYEGITVNDTSNDVLLIFAGFEDKLTAEVAEDKGKARKILLQGLPSLKADMYQQSVLRTQKANDALGVGVKRAFAPAGDPFATATVLSGVIEHERNARGIGNLYLSPLSTKPSTLGFALYYIRECEGSAVSVIYPFSAGYASDASEGVGRIWRYAVELQ